MEAKTVYCCSTTFLMIRFANHFNRNKLYIRHVLTHREYDKGAWKQ